MWIQAGEKGCHVYFKKHLTRRYGVKYDQYFRAEYQYRKKRTLINFGWASEGWSVSRCQEKIREYKTNAKAGIPPISLKEEREIMAKKKADDEAKQALQKREKTTFSDAFNKYLTQATADRGYDALKTEKGCYKNWIEPVIGNKPLKNIVPFNLEKIKRDMAKTSKSPRTIEYVLAIIRQTFNYAKNNNMFAGDSPTSKVKVPRVDNKRTRFLNRDEADLLLSELKSCPQVYNMALLSLHTGARAGEIFSLTFSCIDLDTGTVLLKDTKNRDSRTVYLTVSSKEVLIRLMTEKYNRNDLVFPNKKGKKYSQIPKVYRKITGKLFNQDIEDSRQRVIFHTLRHTFASWLVMDGVDLYRVQKLMGHKTLSMTQRYAHLAPDTLKRAISSIESPKYEKKRKNIKKTESY